uniref:MBD domain-containing protein n=1 Tax=Stegastes partitus TaxID=144197 RepID=A0A3B5B2C6_9TELE
MELETRRDVNNQSHKDEPDSWHTSAMPPGWMKEVRQRKAGKTAGKLDVYITSPQGQRFRSRASLHAFLLKSGKGNLDISLFDFTTSKDDVASSSQILPSRVKQARRKKKHADVQQEKREDVKEILDPPPNKFKKASFSLVSDPKDRNIESAEDTGHNEVEKITQVLEVCRDKIDEAGCSQAAPSGKVDDPKLQKSPQRVGLLREKLLRLAPSSNQESIIIVHKDEQADSQPSVPTLKVERETECVNEGEDEPDADEIQIHSKGDDKPNSELKADVDSLQHVEEEVLLADITDGSCTPIRESQNSKYDLGCVTAC